MILKFLKLINLTDMDMNSSLNVVIFKVQKFRTLNHEIIQGTRNAPATM